MKLVHRFAYYLGGFAIGIVILFFFLSGKRTSCDYGPDARVLKNIRLKERIFTEGSLATINSKDIDTAAISKALKYGDVDFSASTTDLDSCKIYRITFKDSIKTISFDAENCKNTATISNLAIED